MDGDFPLGDHLAALAGRTRADEDRLTHLLIGRSWPGGHGDRTERIALEWVKRWGAVKTELPMPRCRCAAGRCHVCN